MKRMILLLTCGVLGGCFHPMLLDQRVLEDEKKPPPVNQEKMYEALKKGNDEIENDVLRLNRFHIAQKGDQFLERKLEIVAVHRNKDIAEIELLNRGKVNQSFVYAFHYFLSNTKEVILYGGLLYLEAHVSAGDTIVLESDPLCFGAVHVGVEVMQLEREKE